MGLTRIRTQSFGTNDITANKATTGLIADLSGWEHIETKVMSSDGDSSVQSDYGDNKVIRIDVSSVKHLYSEYLIKWHWVCPVGSTVSHDLLVDTLQADGATETAAGTWIGGGARMSYNSLASALGRSSSSTMKTISNVWPIGVAPDWKAGAVGEVKCKGFMAEVTQDIDSQSAINGYYSGLYRCYFNSEFQTYDDANDVYVGDIAFCRQNQNFDSDNTSGANSFGGFSFRWNSNNIEFAKGTSYSIYGLRLPTV